MDISQLQGWFFSVLEVFLMDTRSRIFLLLDELNMEQKTLASVLGLPADTVSAWRRGKSASYTKYLPQIAEALGTTTEYLLTGEGLKKKSVPAVSDSDTVQSRQAAAPKDSGLPEEFARLFMSLSPENQNAVIAEMLKRQREQGYRVDQVPGEK